MSSWIAPIVSWVMEVYVLSTVILSVAVVAMLIVRQPSRRLAVARAALLSLVLLGPIAGVASWVRSSKGAAVVAGTIASSPDARMPCCGGPFRIARKRSRGDGAARGGDRRIRRGIGRDDHLAGAGSNGLVPADRSIL